MLIDSEEMKILIDILNREQLSLELHPLGTDKGGPHTYLENFYGPLFQIVGEPRSIFEIGIQHKASLALWKIAFVNSDISGCDVDLAQPTHPAAEKLIQANSIKVSQMDPYLDSTEIPTGLHVLIDDGPHTIVSQIKALEFRNKLAHDGLLIIEDVGDVGGPYFCFPILLKSLPLALRKNCLIFDFTKSGRWDDAIFLYVADKTTRTAIKKNLGQYYKNRFKVYAVYRLLLVKRKKSTLRSLFRKVITAQQ